MKRAVDDIWTDIEKQEEEGRRVRAKIVDFKQELIKHEEWNTAARLRHCLPEYLHEPLLEKHALGGKLKSFDICVLDRQPYDGQLCDGITMMVRIQGTEEQVKVFKKITASRPRGGVIEQTHVLKHPHPLPTEVVTQETIYKDALVTNKGDAFLALCSLVDDAYALFDERMRYADWDIGTPDLIKRAWLVRKLDVDALEDKDVIKADLQRYVEYLGIRDQEGAPVWITEERAKKINFMRSLPESLDDILDLDLADIV